MCIYIYIYIYVYICIYLYTHIYVYRSIYICIDICIYRYISIFANFVLQKYTLQQNGPCGGGDDFRPFRSVMMAKKLRSRCLRLRQRQPKQVHAGSPNAHQGGRSDCACVARPGAGPARPMFGAPHACAGLAPGRAKHARSGRPP